MMCVHKFPYTIRNIRAMTTSSEEGSKSPTSQKQLYNGGQNGKSQAHIAREIKCIARKHDPSPYFLAAGGQVNTAFPYKIGLITQVGGTGSKKHDALKQAEIKYSNI